MYLSPGQACLQTARLKEQQTGASSADAQKEKEKMWPFKKKEKKKEKNPYTATHPAYQSNQPVTPVYDPYMSYGISQPVDNAPSENHSSHHDSSSDHSSSYDSGGSYDSGSSGCDSGGGGDGGGGGCD